MNEMIFSDNEIIYHVKKHVTEKGVAKSVPDPNRESGFFSLFKRNEYKFDGFRDCNHKKFMKTHKEAVYVRKK